MLHVRRKDNNNWLSYIEDYPDYLTQRNSIDELKEHLKDLHKDFTNGEISYIVSKTY